MTAVETLRGLVIREIPYREQDKLLTLLTREHGKILVTGHGVRNLKSRNFACAQLLCFGEFTLEKRRDRWSLKESSLLQNFFGIRRSLAAFAFSQYACEVCAEAAAEEQEDEGGLLPLLLNTLYAAETAENFTRAIPKIKAAFELRLCTVSGFLPELHHCVGCERPLSAAEQEGEPLYFSTVEGGVLCRRCGQMRHKAAMMQKQNGLVPPPSLHPLPLSADCLAALRHVCEGEGKRIFSFTLPAKEMEEFAALSERYLLDQFGRGYRTLSFYQEVLKEDIT